MSLIVQLVLTDAHLDAIAERVAALHKGNVGGEPYTKEEAAKALRLSVRTIERRLEAGTILKIPNVGAVRIPASEIERLRNPNGGDGR